MYLYLVILGLLASGTMQATGVFSCTSQSLQEVLGSYSSQCQLYFTDALTLSAE